MDVTVLRGIGAPFVMTQGLVQNQIRLKVQNRTDAAQAYSIELVEPGHLKLVAPQNPLNVAAGAHAETSVFVLAAPDTFTAGSRGVSFRLTDPSGQSKVVEYRLLGPQGPVGGAP
jgi:uncharacterized protein YfaS (alpha-2-macroglobulin family)